MERHVWEEMDWGWQAFAALFAAVTAVLLVLAREWVALGLLVAVALWYALTGARALHRSRATRPGVAYVAGATPLVLAMFALTPIGAVLFFLLFPHFWRLLPVRWALLVTTLAIVGIGAVRMVPAALGTGEVPLVVAWLGGMLVASLFLGSWITRIVAQSSERAALLDELERTRAELAAASRDLGALAERERLAREIHDTLAQGFSSILLLAQGMDPDDPKVALVERTARENLGEARALVAALSSPQLDAATLPAALNRLVERVGDELGIEARMRVEGAERALPPGHDIVLMRVSQEAMANVRKHAGASRLDLELIFDPASAVVRISDDGRGFDPAAARRSGFGLTGMRARVGELGGALDLRSEPGGGTCVEVRLG
ncbi:sensor histidine kinase [Pseudonocardia humida]|uniref:histidine kinase n=1 Tax=Pseudonocardia humida TaxID=2800819 RepID=A0ABT0ZTX5_9PSEU|nr:sensor histidine kinase [Pseudonocardia humida]MCO1654173.1 sensor histidine kinase [Pseudonocardia humida]